jgi:hypothetical protein
MVFAVILTHGRYTEEGIKMPDVKLPYNIRLITYTHPGKVLSSRTVEYILKQILDKEQLAQSIPGIKSNNKGNYNFTLKENLLNLDLNNETFIIKSPPLIKQVSKTYVYPRNDVRIIGDEFEPEGKFKIYAPNGKVPNIEVEFKEDSGNFSRSHYGEPKMVRQTRDGSELVLKYYRNKSFERSIGYFLKELSCFYEEEFPGKVVNVLQLSCRADYRSGSMSVDELADDMEQRLSFKERKLRPGSHGMIDYDTPDVRLGIHGLSQSQTSEGFYNNPDFEYIDIHPPLIIKKSEDVPLPPHSDCSEPNAFDNYKIGGVKRYTKNIKSKKSKKSKKSNRNKSRKKTKKSKKSKRRN